MPFIITPRQLVQRSELYSQLASLLTAGVALVQALELIQNKPPSYSYRQPLGAILANIHSGASFADSLSSLGRWMPSFDLALIRAAEQSGRLAESMRLLSDYYRQRAQFARSFMAQVAYPFFLVHLALVIFPTQLLPQLVWEGQVLQFLQHKMMVFVPLYAIGFLLIFASQGRHGEAWRSLVERFVRPVPALGRAKHGMALARLAVALEALISAGVSIIDGWQLAADASGSPALRRAVLSWKPSIQAGETPGEMVSRSSAFPELFSNLYNTGEISGQLDDSLRRLHQYYEEESTRLLHSFIRGFSMLVYLLIAAAIGYQIISFWKNYYGNIMQGF
jgi:type II secretory pathway component PulF